MANDDFMYSRQEQPRPQFVTDLRKSLTETDAEPTLIARVWRPDSLSQRLASVAAVFLLFSAILFSASPYARAAVLQVFDSIVALSDEDAHTVFPFDMPQVIPVGFERETTAYDEDEAGIVTPIEADNEEVVIVPDGFGDERPIVFVLWTHIETGCQITLFISEDRTAPETRLATLERNIDFAARYDWMEVFPVGNTDTRAVWRLITSGVSTMPDTMRIEWTTSAGIRHNMSTTVECLSQEDFIAMAQSAE